MRYHRIITNVLMLLLVSITITACSNQQAAYQLYPPAAILSAPPEPFGKRLNAALNSQDQKIKGLRSDWLYDFSQDADTLRERYILAQDYIKGLMEKNQK